MYSVIIVGAGMSGVKAAGDLYKAGQTNTLILEARNRLGGRLLSQQSMLDPKVYYDFGALWFHDGLENPLFEKAKKRGNVDFFFDDGKFHYVAEDNDDIPVWDFERVVLEISTFGRRFFEKNPHHNDITLRDMCQKYLEAQEKHLTAKEKKYAQQVVRMWMEMWDGILWDQASAKHSFLWGEDHLGRNAYVKSGFYHVYESELHELPRAYRESRIKCDVQVKHIDYLNPQYVTITTSKGETYQAKHVIVTAPTSILRITDPADKCRLEWTPSLPERLTSLWPETEFGSLGKVVFEFDECFWPEDVQRFYVLASELATAGDARPWQHPALIVNYKAMGSVPSLVILTQNTVSKQVENMSDELVWQLFRPVIEKIATGAVKKPFKVLRTPWNNDVWTRGAYSAGRLGTRPTSEVCDLLAEGVTKRVRFAGAETVSGSANGCVHGAYLSGEREARFILAQQNQSKL